MKRNLCLLALLCLFLRLSAQGNHSNNSVKPAFARGDSLTRYASNPFAQTKSILLGSTKTVLYQSSLLPYTAGLPVGYVVFPTDLETGKRILATNCGLLSLFSLAYSKTGLYFDRNRTILEVEDSNAFYSSESENVDKAALQGGQVWCYELIVPASEAGRALEIMQEDLKRFFPQYTAKVEKRKMRCLALVRSPKKALSKAPEPIVSKGGMHGIDLSPSGIEIRNGLLTDLVALLNADYLQELPTPVIDETGYTGRIDLKLETNRSDVASIREALRDYGLDLVEAERKIKVLVVRDSGKH